VGKVRIGHALPCRNNPLTAHTNLHMIKVIRYHPKDQHMMLSHISTDNPHRAQNSPPAASTAAYSSISSTMSSSNNNNKSHNPKKCE